MPDRQVALPDATLALTDEGEGEVILWLHGFPLNRFMWREQLIEFKQSHRVLAPDLRGHGQSTVTAGTVTMEQMAEDVHGLLNELKIEEPITLCGLSMGGYVAWEFYRHHAQRLRRLILCDTRATGDTPEVARGRAMMAAEVLRDGSTVAAESMLPKLFASQTHKDAPEKVTAIQQMILATPPQGIAATQRGMAARRNMTAQLAEIELPTLVLCGAEDTISPPEEMRQVAAAMPHAEFVEIATAGHLAPFEQPTATNQAIRKFLANS